MHNVTERVYIFSVFNSKRAKVLNEVEHDVTIQTLKAKHYTPTEVVGRYNGIDEKSIMLYGTNLTEPMVRELCAKNFQESFLVVYHDGVAELVYSNDNRKILGDFVPVTETEAKARDAYSKIGNQYFVVE